MTAETNANFKPAARCVLNNKILFTTSAAKEQGGAFEAADVGLYWCRRRQPSTGSDKTLICSEPDSSIASSWWNNQGFQWQPGNLQVRQSLLGAPPARRESAKAQYKKTRPH